MTTRKIIGIGPNKTGTVTLWRVLEDVYGLRVLHDAGIGKAVTDAALRGNRHPAFDDFDVFLDGPYHRAAMEFRKFEDVSYLLHVRDLEKWITSRLTHVLYNRVTKTSQWLHADTYRWRSEWNKIHNTAYELKKLGEQVVFFDACGESDNPTGFEGLEPFDLTPLKPLPDWPKYNTGTDRLQRILEHYGG